MYDGRHCCGSRCGGCTRVSLKEGSESEEIIWGRRQRGTKVSVQEGEGGEGLKGFPVCETHRSQFRRADVSNLLPPLVGSKNN